MISRVAVDARLLQSCDTRSLRFAVNPGFHTITRISCSTMMAAKLNRKVKQLIVAVLYDPYVTHDQWRNGAGWGRLEEFWSCAL